MEMTARLLTSRANRDGSCRIGWVRSRVCAQMGEAMRGGQLVQLTAIGAVATMLVMPMAQATPTSRGDAEIETDPASTEVPSDTQPAPVSDPVEVEVETTVVDEDPVGNTVTLTAEAGPLRVVGVTWIDDEAEASADHDGAHDHAVEIQYRTHDGDAWSSWEEIHVEDLSGETPSERAGAEPVAVIDVDQVEVAVTADSAELLASVEMVVIDPGEDDSEELPATPDTDTAAARSMATTAVSAPASGRPTIRSRAAWGADESIRTWRPQLGRVTGAVVHHTAGANNYSSAQVPAIIRGIYQFHTVTRGWGDIGYNVLIDRFGRAWEGRYGGVENAVIGAHAKGANDTTFGVSLIGNFEKAQVSSAAFRTLAQVIGWKFSWHGITTGGSAVGPNGRSINRITGHRDVGQTACPGRHMYSRLGELRSMVAQYQRSTPPRSQPPYERVRLGGKDRYETAVITQRWTHLISTTQTVFIATGAEYADALSAASAAARRNAPVLLVQPNKVPASVISELERTKPSRIYVLGGSNAISNSVVSTLRRTVPDVRRLSGDDRYRTATRIAQATFGSVNEVFISSGEGFADAVSGGAAAARRDAPMYLTRARDLPWATAAELRRTQPARIRLIGGEQVISEAVKREIQQIVPGATIERIAGRDRYGTSLEVARKFWPGTASRAYYATGQDWPDALSAGWAAGAQHAPLLLVRGTCTPGALQQQTTRLRPNTALIVGGPNVVADNAVERRC